MKRIGKMKKFILFCLLQTISIINIYAQSISVSFPNRVRVGDNFRIAYTINTKDADDFRAGDFPTGIEVIAGPYTSSQSSFQMVNGHTSSSSSITYTYTCYASQKGTFNIPSASAKINGKLHKSRSIKIIVDESSGGNSSNQHKNSNSSNIRIPIDGNKLFIKVSANKKRVKEQEPVILTYKVYTNVDLTQLSGKMPDLTGFHTHEIPLPQQKSFHLEKLNGKLYRSVVWSQYVMYPQITGSLTVPKITFSGLVVLPNQNVDPFEAFFNGGSGYTEVKRDVVAPEIKLQVDSLPRRPKDFSGGVGQFNITSNLISKTIKTGMPFTLRVIISGVGNLKLIKQPTVVFPKDFEVYDPKISDQTKVTTNGIEGNMVYDFIAIPKNTGTFTIPAIKFVYFDLNTNNYKTISTQKIVFNVSQGSRSSENIEDYTSLKDQDIHTIRPHALSWFDCSSFFGSFYFIIILIAPILLYGFAVYYYRKVWVNRGNNINRAKTIAKKHLYFAKNLMDNQKVPEFYAEIMSLLQNYVCIKVGLPIESFTKELTISELSKYSVSQETINKLISIINECELAKFTPLDMNNKMNTIYEDTERIIEVVEKEYSKSSKKSKPKTLSLIIIMLMMSLMANATTRSDADKEYQNGNYHQAILLYQDCLKEDPNSAAIHYNLGNAFYRTNNIPASILEYERALKLAPADKDIQFNLRFVKSKTIDNIATNDEMFFVTWYKDFYNILGANGWAFFSVLFLAISMFCLFIYKVNKEGKIKKASYYVCFMMGFMSVLSLFWGWKQYGRFKNTAGGVVVIPSTKLKLTPSEQSKTIMDIHEGTCVEINDTTMSNWFDVTLDDGTKGWVQKQSIEKI